MFLDEKKKRMKRKIKCCRRKKKNRSLSTFQSKFFANILLGGSTETSVVVYEFRNDFVLTLASNLLRKGVCGLLLSHSDRVVGGQQPPDTVQVPSSGCQPQRRLAIPAGVDND